MKRLRYSEIRDAAKRIGKRALSAAAPVAVGAALAFKAFFTPDIALAETCSSKVSPYTSTMKKEKAAWSKDGKHFQMFIGLDETNALVVTLPSSFLERHKGISYNGLVTLDEMNATYAVMLHLKDQEGKWTCIGKGKPKKAPEDTGRLDKVRAQIKEAVKEAGAAIERRKRVYDVTPAYAHLERALIISQKQELSQADALQAIEHLEDVHKALENAERKPGMLTKDEVEGIRFSFNLTKERLKAAKPLLKGDRAEAKSALRKAEQQAFFALHKLKGVRQIRRYIGYLARAHKILVKESPSKRELRKAYAFVKRASSLNPSRLRKIGRAKKKEEAAYAKLGVILEDTQRWDDEREKPTAKAAPKSAQKVLPKDTQKSAPKVTPPGKEESETLDALAFNWLRQAEITLDNAGPTTRSPEKVKQSLREAIGNISQAIEMVKGGRQVVDAIAQVAKAHAILKKKSPSKIELIKAYALLRKAVKAADLIKLKKLTGTRSDKEQNALKKMDEINGDIRKWKQEQAEKEAAKPKPQAKRKVPKNWVTVKVRGSGKNPLLDNGKPFSRLDSGKILKVTEASVRKVYERAQKRNNDYKAKVEVKFSLNRRGRITAISFRGDILDRKLMNDLVNVYENAVFKKDREASEIIFPLILKPKGN